MRPPGIVIQLDELEYLLPGLYPGVVLAIEGKLPFQGLEERLHDGVVVRAALAGKRSDEPATLELPAKPARGVLAAPIRVNHEPLFRIFPVHGVVKGVDHQILVDAGGTPAIRLSCARTGRDGWPGRAILPSWGCRRCRRTTLFLFWTENSPFKTSVPLSEAFPPLLYFLGPCRIPAPSSPSCAARSCRSRRCRSRKARRRSASTRTCDCWRRRCPRRTAPAPRGLSASMIWGGSGRHNIRPC